MVKLVARGSNSGTIPAMFSMLHPWLEEEVSAWPKLVRGWSTKPSMELQMKTKNAGPALLVHLLNKTRRSDSAVQKPTLGQI
jgi:hypothetical protein